jgi:branched-chain amino acid transport system ATP-binding protein
MNALLSVRNLTRWFGALRAVNELSFSVMPGELVGLIGPNGAGKSPDGSLIRLRARGSRVRFRSPNHIGTCAS